MTYTPDAPTEVRHDTVAVNGTELHVVSAGDHGSPVLLVHGFPESSHAFHRVIPLLSHRHRVFAVDLRGFGRSAVAGPDHTSATATEDLRLLLEHLDLGPVHVTAQDVAGGPVHRLAATEPGLVRSLTAIEMGLPGFGLEDFADVRNGGSWHIGALAAPGIAELLLSGREREVLARWAFPSMTLVEGAVTDADLDEFAGGFARPGGWNGAAGLYRSLLADGEELRALAAQRPLRMPTLAIGAGGGPFTAMTLEQVAEGPVRQVVLDGVGHYAALEAPERVAEELLAFWADVDLS